MSVEKRCCYILDTKGTPGVRTKTCVADDREKLVLCSTSTEGCTRPTSRLSTMKSTCSAVRGDSDVMCIEIGLPSSDVYTLLIGDPDHMTQAICSDDSAKSHCLCMRDFVL